MAGTAAAAAVHAWSRCVNVLLLLLTAGPTTPGRQTQKLQPKQPCSLQKKRRRQRRPVIKARKQLARYGGSMGSNTADPKLTLKSDMQVGTQWVAMQAPEFASWQKHSQMLRCLEHGMPDNGYFFRCRLARCRLCRSYSIYGAGKGSQRQSQRRPPFSSPNLTVRQQHGNIIEKNDPFKLLFGFVPVKLSGVLSHPFGSEQLCS